MLHDMFAGIFGFLCVPSYSRSIPGFVVFWVFRGARDPKHLQVFRTAILKPCTLIYKAIGFRWQRGKP